MTFTISTIIGILLVFLVALILKHSHIRRYPQIETCLVLLFAYQSYFFSNGAHMSGIVSFIVLWYHFKTLCLFQYVQKNPNSPHFSIVAQLSEKISYSFTWGCPYLLRLN